MYCKGIYAGCCAVMVPCEPCERIARGRSTIAQELSNKQKSGNRCIDMKLIKTNKGDIIKLDGSIKGITNHRSCWGWRWNKNEGRFGTQCVLFTFASYKQVGESELTVTKPIDVE